MTWGKFIELVEQAIASGLPSPGSYPSKPAIVARASATIGRLIRQQFTSEYGILKFTDIPDSGYIYFEKVPVEKCKGYALIPLPSLPAITNIRLFYPEDRSMQFVVVDAGKLASLYGAGTVNAAAAEGKFFASFENNGHPAMRIYDFPNTVGFLDVSMVPGEYTPASYSEHIPIPGDLESTLIEITTQFFMVPQGGQDNAGDNKDLSVAK